MAFGSRVRAWVGAREAGTLAALLLAAGGVWLFLEIADEVLEGDYGERRRAAAAHAARAR